MGTAPIKVLHYYYYYYYHYYYYYYYYYYYSSTEAEARMARGSRGRTSLCDAVHVSLLDVSHVAQRGEDHKAGEDTGGTVDDWNYQGVPAHTHHRDRERLDWIG